jgi:hypothetical protein
VDRRLTPRRRAARRLGPFLAAATLVFGGLIATTEAATSGVAAPITAAVSWKVDHAAKTITVSVNIAVFVSTRPDNARVEAAVSDAAARIEADIRRVWSNLNFKCYQFIVDPHVRTVASEQAVRNNELGILLDTALYPAGSALFPKGTPGSEPVRSKVIWEAGAAAPEVLSDSPPDPGLALPAGPKVTYRSVWAFMERPGVYAHEFGHILGLQDNYKGPSLVPGAPFDVMFYQTLAVSPETVTKVIRRSGEVDESTIKCPISIDLPPYMFGAPPGIPGSVGGTVSFHAYACDYDPPTADVSRRKPIAVKGTFSGSGHADAGPFGSTAGDGESEFDVVIPPPFGLVEGSSVFTIPLQDGITVDTPLKFEATGLRDAGHTTATVDGVELDLGTVVVSKGAPECT